MTSEYSIILARGRRGIWHGTAVGRNQVWIKDAPYTPMKRIEWVLENNKSQQLDDAISRYCTNDRSAITLNSSEAPPLGYIAQRVDVVRPGRTTITYNSSTGNHVIASIIQPPE